MTSSPEIPFAPMDAIPQGGLYEPDYVQRTPSEIRNGTYFERGDILVAKITPSFENGKQALTAALPTPFGVATTEVIPLRPRGAGHDPRFLFFYLLHPDIRQHVAGRMEGSTGRQRVPVEVLLDLPIPAFDPQEQRTIADSLELVQRLSALAARSVQTATALRRTAMHTLFTRGLRGETQKETSIGPMPEGWEAEAIGDLFEIEQGLSLKGNLADDGNGIPFLRTSNVYWGEVNLQAVSRMRISGDLPSDKLLREGDLLVCEGGEIGRAAVWSGQIETCLYQNHLHRLRPLDASQTNSQFAMAWLEEGFKHRNAYDGAENRTTIPNLSRTRLAGLSVPHPSADEQHEIVAVLDAMDRKIDLHLRKRALLVELFRTLLHKLMTGELRVEELDFRASAEVIHET